MATNIGSLEIKLFASIAKLQNDMDKASKHIDSFSKRTEASLGRASSAFKGLFAGITVNTVARLADEYKKFDAQLKLATSTVEDYNAAYSNVLRIGRTAMSDIGAIGVLYARLTNNLRDYGTAQSEISDITETVSLALRVNNATVQETNSVMLQLSQSFGSGRINGQEFLAVMEGAPILMRQLAKSIGVPYGELKKLSEQGQLTADLLTKAWTDPVFLNLLRQQVKEVGTISSAYTVLINNLKQYIGEADKATGATRAISSVIMAVGDNINLLVNIGFAALIVSLGRSAAAMYASIKASQLRQIELVKETVLLDRKAASEARVAAAQAAALANNARATTLWALRNADAYTVNATAMRRMAAQATIAARAKQVLAGALTLVGGKVGLVIIGITSAVAALIKITNWAKDSAKASADAGQGFNGVAASLNKLNLEGQKSMQWMPSFLKHYEAYRQKMDELAGKETKAPESNLILQPGARIDQPLPMSPAAVAAKKAYDEFAKDNKLNDLIAATEKYKAALKILDDALAQGIIRNDEYVRRVAAIKEEYDKASGALKRQKADEKEAAAEARLLAQERKAMFKELAQAQEEINESNRKARESVLDESDSAIETLQREIDVTNESISVMMNGEEGHRRLAIARLNEAIAAGEQIIAQDRLNGASEEGIIIQQRYIDNLKEQVELNKTLGERLAIERNLEKVRDEEKKAADEAEKDALKEKQKLAKDLGLTFTSAFEDAVIAGKKFSDVLQGLAQDIQRIILRKTITEPLGGAISGFVDKIDFGELFSFANGGVMSSKGSLPLNKYANGGVATGPQVALFGEGRMNEAYVPLPDGRNIPVKMEGGGGGATINQTINIDARGADAGVEAKIRQAVAEGAKQGYALVINDLSRGGPVARLTGAAS